MLIITENEFNNPKLVNSEGGILISRVGGGNSIYIDNKHPQYDEVSTGGLLGNVTLDLLDNITLDDLKTNKNVNLTKAAQLKITSGAVSGVLGEDHLYPTDPISQSNLQALVVNNTDNVFMCQDLSGIWLRRIHTAAQLKTLLSDGVTFIQAVLNELDVRRLQTQDASNESELDNVSEVF